MSEHNSGSRTSVGLIDIATRVPGRVGRHSGDRPRRAHRALGAAELQGVDRQSLPGSRRPLRRPGVHPVRRAAADLPRGQRDRQPLRGGAGRPRRRPRRRRRDHAAQLTQCRADDAGRGQVRRGRRDAQLPPARRGAGAQPGPAGRQGAGRRIRLGRRGGRVRRARSHPDDDRGDGAAVGHRADRQPAVGVGGAGQGHRVLHLHVGHHRSPQGQRDDP